MNIQTKKNEKNVTIAAIYCPPRKKLKEKKKDYLELFQTLGDHFIIGDNYNAKHTYWGSDKDSTKGRELLKAVLAMKYKFQSIGKPTYWPADPRNRPSLIDFFVIRGIATGYTCIEECFDLTSDHSPIILTINETAITKQKPPYLTNKLTCWEGYRKEIELRIALNTPLKAAEQLDYEVDKLVVDLQQVAWNNTPPVRPKTPGISYIKAIRDLVQEKRKTRKKWQQTRSPDDKKRLNKFSEQLKLEIRAAKNETFTEY